MYVNHREGEGDGREEEAATFDGPDETRAFGMRPGGNFYAHTDTHRSEKLTFRNSAKAISRKIAIRMSRQSPETRLSGNTTSA